jgi:hypothetical protein
MRDIDFALSQAELFVLTDGRRRGVDALSLGFREAVVVDRDAPVEPGRFDAAVVDVAELTLPRLMAAPDRDVIINALAAFLDHRGSVSLAAKSLNLHRNTLQARLNRARELGVPLDIPSELLSVHLIAKVLRRFMPDKATSEDALENQKGLP